MLPSREGARGKEASGGLCVWVSREQRGHSDPTACLCHPRDGALRVPHGYSPGDGLCVGKEHVSNELPSALPVTDSAVVQPHSGEGWRLHKRLAVLRHSLASQRLLSKPRPLGLRGKRTLPWPPPWNCLLCVTVIPEDKPPTHSNVVFPLLL